jgi:hypothetical protein
MMITSAVKGRYLTNDMTVYIRPFGRDLPVFPRPSPFMTAAPASGAASSRAFASAARILGLTHPQQPARHRLVGCPDGVDL